jgi:hypothetical protein
MLGTSVEAAFFLLARPCGEEEDGRTKAVEGDDDKCRNIVNPEVLRRETRSNRMANMMMMMPLVRLLLEKKEKKDLGRDLRCGPGMIR